MKIKDSLELEKIKENLIEIKELLSILIDNPTSLSKEFSKASYELLTAFQKKFMERLDNVLQHKYKVSIRGFLVGDERLHSGLMQNENKNLATFLLVLSNMPKYVNALSFLVQNIPILKRANYALQNKEVINSVFKKLIYSQITSDVQELARNENFLSDLDFIGMYMSELGEFCPMTMIPCLISVCDLLLNFKDNRAAVLRLNQFYQQTYELFDNFQNPLLQLKVLVGYSLYMNSYGSAQVILKKLQDIFLKNTDQQIFYKTLCSMLNNFIDAQHSTILMKDFSNNQSLEIWQSFKDILKGYQTDCEDKIDLMIAQIKEHENSQETDDELPVTPILVSTETCAKITTHEVLNVDIEQVSNQLFWQEKKPYPNLSTIFDDDLLNTTRKQV